MDMGHWKLCEGVYYYDNFFGFVYSILNKKNGKVYIGKKQCTVKIKRKPLKGKKRNRIDKKDSDWKTYTGSSKELNDDIKKLGKENFEFTILKLCDSKWELGYEEIKEQLKRDVLLNEKYYNGIINVRIGRPPMSLKNKDNSLQ